MKILTTIIFILLASCNHTVSDKSTLDRVDKEPKADTLSSNVKNDERSLATDPYDSLANIQIDTTTLQGKRQWIMNQFLIEEPLLIYDTLFDLTYDGFEDYVIGYYGKAGTGIKNRVIIYFYDPANSSYILNDQLSDLLNPTFYIKQKKITGFYLANGGGDGSKLEWLNKKWTLTKEFYVSNEGDSTKWNINYPLRKKSEVKMRPYEWIPPQDILETNYKE
jgi:hypothetical protein